MGRKRRRKDTEREKERRARVRASERGSVYTCVSDNVEQRRRVCLLNSERGSECGSVS